jgi:hypothetical protein
VSYKLNTLFQGKVIFVFESVKDEEESQLDYLCIFIC